MPKGSSASAIALLSTLAAVLFSVLGNAAAYAAEGSPSPRATVDGNRIGINIAAPLDYEEDRLYTDVIRTSRAFIAGLDENSSSAGLAPLDANGWPTSDFSFYVWASLDQRHGTYTLSFTGQANVEAHPVGNVTITYDQATNTSTGTLQYANASESFLALRFSATRRTSGSVLGSGVTSIRLMRPITPGAAQSYPPTTVFNAPIKSLVSKFSVIRFMDFVSTNSNLQTSWSDRTLPSWPSYNRNPGGTYGWQGLGGPWEHVILLANETGKDAWINIPALANDAYVRNVALMFAYGSDGINPYSGPQANPVYPPLNADLKIYVEYSNELWNSAGAFTQFHDNCQAASDELVSTSGNSPLNWDGSWNGTAYNRSAPGNWNWDMCWRRIAKRGVEVSNIFRSVFGDTGMGPRIRPLLMTQLGAPGRVLAPAMKMMLDYYDNMAGNFVATPQSPNHYFFGAGGSGYYNPAPTVATLDALFADPGMKPAGVTPAFQGDAALVAAMGLKRIAYEGGPSLDRTDGAVDAIYAQAVQDSRMTTAIVDIHNAWSNNGGDLLVYYRATGDYQWGFTPDIYNLATPKMLAVDALNAATRAPLTFGTPVPGSKAGNLPDTCSRVWGCDPIESWDNFTADGSKITWASYSFGSSAPAQWAVKLSVTNANAATVAVYVDGTLIGTQPATGGMLSFGAGAIDAGLHGVIVRAATGTFSLATVAVELVGGGVCGGDHGQTLSSIPVNLCTAGTASDVAVGTLGYAWTCAGDSGTATAHCGAPRGYSLTAAAGPGGTVAPASQLVSYGGKGTVQVTPNSGYHAIITSSCGGNLSGPGFVSGAVTAPCSVAVTFNNTAIGATYPLNINKNGSGSGSVTSDQIGIDCGGDCTESYPAGTGVTLTATPWSGSQFLGWTGACTGTANTCQVTLSAARNVVARFNATSANTIGSTLDNTGLFWASGGDAAWTIDATVVHSGVGAMRSGDIGNYGSSSLTTTVRGPGTLSYYWRVSSEGEHDELHFYLDGLQQTGSISGEVAWVQATRDIPAGLHEVSWEYRKDGATASGSDAGWVDSIVMLPFGDVGAMSWAAAHIDGIYNAGITTGCGSGNYCPTGNVTREQIAAFLVRAMEGEPPAGYCGTSSPFLDVSNSSGMCGYIKRLMELSITTGCGGGNYCPASNVTRDQMAVLVVKAMEGSVPANYCGAVAPFSDVPAGHWACGYIKRLSELAITTGCGSGKYCPTAIVSREQMAAFLARAFLGM